MINGTTSLNFTISNPNSSKSLTGVQFVGGDSLPGGLVVDTPNGLSSVTCDAGSLTGAIIGAAAGSSSITLTGGTLSPGALCHFSVNVKGTSLGLKNNSVTISATETGAGNTSTASLVVKGQTPSISLLKQVSLSSTGPWSNFVAVPTPLPQNVYFQFTVENTGDTQLTNVQVHDATIPGLDLSNCAAALSAGLDLYQSVTCLAGPETVVSSGVYSNTAYATSDQAISANSTVRYATAGLLLVKNVTESYFTAAGNVLHYTYNVTNNGSTDLAAPVTISDDKTTVTCPAVTTVGDYDNSFDIGESISCTATYSVTAADVTAGNVTNTATAHAG
jgi:uncharacterized repeat protein (TIGR01451 family)